MVQPEGFSPTFGYSTGIVNEYRLSVLLIIRKFFGTISI